MRTRSVILALSLASPFAGGGVAAQQPSAPPPAPAIIPSVEVSGYGEGRTTPDRALVSVGVETRASTAAEASRLNARLQRAVIDTIRALGVASAQIMTVDYSVYPEQVYEPQRGDTKPRITGYVVRNTVRVELRKLDLVSSVIDAAIAKGANGVSGLHFYASNEAEARRAALDEAVKRAEGDAKVIARAAGRCLGEIVELTTVQSRTPLPVMRETRMMAAADAGPTPVEPGEQTVTATVTARWRLVEVSANCR